MLRKVTVLTMMALLIATGAFATDFTNGGFETGDFTGWTKNGGQFTGVYNYTGDPGKSAVVGVGNDPNTLNQLPQVPLGYGSYSGRVNNQDNNYHFSTLSQTVAAPTGITNIYFAWAAVLEEPTNGVGHDGVYPNFSISLFDNTTSTSLYNKQFDVSNASGFVTWHIGAVEGGGNGVWRYSDWQIVALNAAGLDGDSLTLTVLASDCGLGGHGGYAYVDGFGYVKPPPVVPAPSTLLLLGSGLAGLIGMARRRLS